LDIQGADLITVALLVALEGLLSADNAMVLAVLVLGLPRKQQRQALHYGIIGAFAFRIVAILLAVYLIQLQWVMLIGAAYLLWLPFHHFIAHPDAAARRRPKQARSWLGLPPFWATVTKVELTDIVFAIDSILVAVAMSNKLWVIITGGILGVVAMRVVIGRLLVLVHRFPMVVDGAFVIVAWVGIKLILEYLHAAGYIHFEVPRVVALGVILGIFAVSLVWAWITGPVEIDPVTQETEQILAEEQQK
jgi:YkoY family integral membrane protein